MAHQPTQTFIRILLPTLPTGLSMVAMTFAGLEHKAVLNLALPFFFFIVLPLWGVFLVGLQRDRISQGYDSSLGEGVRRWSGVALRLLPIQFLYLGALGGTWSLASWFFQGGSPATGVIFCSALLLASLAWGYSVCEVILRGSDPRLVAWTGPLRATSDLLQLPGRVLSWLADPDLRRVTAGHLPLLAYFLLIWLLPLMLVFVLSGLAFPVLLELGLPARFLDSVLSLTGVALGYELSVTASCHNYMVCLLPESQPEAGKR
jgi:hypothetical protein